MDRLEGWTMTIDGRTEPLESPLEPCLHCDAGPGEPCAPACPGKVEANG